MFGMFIDEWSKRWDRHRNTPLSEWTPIIEFFKAAYPQQPVMPLEKITVTLWRKTIKKKRKHAASGPDGWTRAELLRLPDDITLAILSLMERIEAGAPWPPQITLGLVHSLEKVDNAATVTEYRPITIFSLLYRTWSSIRSKQCLLHLSNIAPARCYGNPPSKSATQLWMAVQTSIEEAQDAAACSGAVIDICKCFNHLPRQPILEISIHLGLPDQVVRAWASALAVLERRFAIKGSVSDAVTSTTGLAEGCGMSVVGMLIVNILIDTWLRLREPSVHLWSYVDNLEITSNDVNHTISGLEQLLRITSLLDLQVDMKKTYLWANNTPERKTLRAAGHEVKLFSRDLGGHVQYSAQATNSVIVGKFAQFKMRWKQLARSAASYKQKLHAIGAAAWPCILHGIGSVHLGDDNYDDLRTNAVRALGEHSYGTSPIVHLSLVEYPNHDPGFYALWQTVSNFRTMIPFDLAQATLDKLAEPSLRKRPRPGPCSVLMHRLQQVGWSWQGNTFVDHFGMNIDVWNCCIQELRLRVVEAWQLRVSHQVNGRKTFAGMEHTSAKLTMERQGRLPPLDRSLMRTCLNGIFFTADHNKYRAEDESTDCMFCGQPDSVGHRFWECPRLEIHRCISPDCKEWVKDKPATRNHGWIPTPPTMITHRAALLKENRDIFHPVHPGFQAEIFEFFTDGSCADPKDKMCRLASWAVVVAHPDDPFHFAPVNVSHLDGYVQTSSRAELKAAIAVCIAAKAWNQPFRIWTDSQFVHNILVQMAKGAFIPNQERKTNHDLVNELFTYMQQASELFRGVVKVASHQCHDNVSEEEAWAFRGNDSADNLAASVFKWNTQVVSTWRAMKAEFQVFRRRRDEIHDMFLLISRHCVTNKTRQADAAPQEPRYRAMEMLEWKFPTVLPAEQQHYNIASWTDIANWVNSLHEPNQQVYRWSWIQLVLDFQNQLDWDIPWYKQIVNAWQTSNPHRADLAKQARNLSLFLIRAARSLGKPLPLRLTAPHSAFQSYRTQTLTVAVEQCRQQKVEDYLATLPRIRGALDFQGVFR